MSEDADQIYLRRCLDLARRGEGFVSPNPMVGACIVYEDKILGEGYHTRFGAPHAEVEAMHAVPEDKVDLLPYATLYVSLEPCNFQGKTPPCTQLILEKKIGKVCIGSEDPNPRVSGKSIQYLRDNNVQVSMAKDPLPFQDLNKVFWINQVLGRSFVLLKYAQSSDGYMGKQGERIEISNNVTNRYTHKLRSTFDAILVGAGTAITDDPWLTTRRIPGRNPVRIILDLKNRCSAGLTVWNTQAPTWLITNKQRLDLPENVNQIVWKDSPVSTNQLATVLYQKGIGS